MKICSTLLRASLCLGMGLSSAAASQPSYQTWVSGTGKDTGSCTLAAPCATFQYAMGQTTTGGTIYATTSGSYGTINITKSVNIIASDGVDASIGASNGTTGVNLSSSSAIVILKGVHINGQSTGDETTGISLASGHLTLDHVSIVDTAIGIEAVGGFLLIQNSLIGGNLTGINGVGTNIYIGESSITGNNMAIYGSVNSYGDNNLNGNTTCDVCQATITEVSHDQ